ncbi:hypothetical protein Theos_2004 [Thermus oshimai JL-2]|uniref:PIN domain-containing protein n=1 Tax=Thermus oshimai JL-2 TaxID=751945 RepID=K7R117_THEOS|nr:type II toxin-antitoxin system VapC family toxin [Thermus oshimai]AFV77005.1 hypothetical protein Theos_2004 [Thermus oshimai JL-2]
MKLLLDTHAFLYFLTGDPRLSPKARRAVEEGEEVYVSAASVWEMAIKASLGRLDLPEDLEAFLAEVFRSEAFLPLPVSLVHAAAVRALPWHHKDPFDRLLVAQAREEGLALVSKEAILDRYGVERIW